jgi:hypothetical protein
MRYRIVLHANFRREAKPLLKKYHSLQEELRALSASLKERPEQGTSIGSSCFKIRIAIRSKGAGKSGGARMITCVVAVREEVYLLSIYDKSEQETLTTKRLKELLKDVPI